MRGNYLSFEMSRSEDGIWKCDDTSKYTIKSKSWIEPGSKDAEQFLSDSIVFSQYGSFYFLSSREKKGWNCLVIEKNKNGFHLSPILPYSDSVNVILNRYFTDVQELQDSTENTYYLIGMNEDELIKFYETYMKKYYYFSFEVESK